MKNSLSLLLILNVLNCFSQEPLDLALYKKTKLINEDICQFRLKNDKWSISNYLYTLNEQEIINDSTILVDLINKSLKTESRKWKKDDLKNIYLVKEGQKLFHREVLDKIEALEKDDIKTLKKQIKQYNHQPKEWRGWPMSVSKPVYSDDNQFCIIAFEFGNNGGYTELYRKFDTEWKLIGIFDRFAY
uniref:hypothetical protein n=1 Tax=Gelidibacter sp. TaxID=2018083 RepID=UPI00404A858F